MNSESARICHVRSAFKVPNHQNETLHNCNLKVLNPRVCRLSDFVRPSFMQTLTLPVQALLDYATNCALWNLNPTFLFKGHYDHL